LNRFGMEPEDSAEKTLRLFVLRDNRPNAIRQNPAIIVVDQQLSLDRRHGPAGTIRSLAYAAGYADRIERRTIAGIDVVSILVVDIEIEDGPFLGNLAQSRGHGGQKRSLVWRLSESCHVRFDRMNASCSAIEADMAADHRA